MATDLEDEIRRAKIAEALSHLDTQDESSPDDVRPRDDLSSEYVGVGDDEPSQSDYPATGQEKKQSSYVLTPPPGHIDLGPPAPPSVRSPEPLDAEYVGIGDEAPSRSDYPAANQEKKQPSYVLTPHPGHIDLGPPPTKTLEPITAESVGQPAPDTLAQVERGELVKPPTEPITDESVRAPDTLSQVERATLVKPPPSAITTPVEPITPQEPTQAPPRVQRAEPPPPIPQPTGPKALGAHTELAPPGQMDLRPDEAAAALVQPVAGKPAPVVSSSYVLTPVDDQGKPLPGSEQPAAQATQDASSYTQPDGTPYPTRTQAVGDKDPAAFIVHHTSGRGTVDGVVSTLKERGLGVEYVMDRDGNISQTGGPGAQNIKAGWGAGAGLNNSNVVGMEIIANDDKDVTDAQKQSFARFIAQRYPNTPLYGHGEVNPGHKEADEGQSAKAAALALRGGGALPADSTGLNVTHFAYPGDPNMDPESKAGHGAYVSQMVPGFDVALNAAAAAKVGNPKPGETFTYGGRTWRYGDHVPERYSDARFDVFDPNNTANLSIARQPAAAQPQASYVLTPVDPVNQAVFDATSQLSKISDTGSQQNILTALHQNLPNMPAFYQALSKPIPGVPDSVREATRDNFKQQITKYAQDYYQEPDPDKAFTRIMQAPNLLTGAGEILSKAPAHVQHAILAMAQGLDANGENRIIDFINKVHPDVTPEARAGFIREILSKPINERTRFVSALYSSVDPQITAGINLPTLLDSIDTAANPQLQQKRQADISAAVAKNLKDLRADPTMENTYGGVVSDAIAQMPKNLGEALFPVIGQSAMTSEIYFDTLEGLRKEHPDWNEDKLKATAGAASVPQVALQEVVNLATMGVGGGLLKGIENPVARIAANSVLHGTVAGAAATAQQGVANWATGQPVTAGMPQAAAAGAIQGAIGGVIGGGHPEAEAPRVMGERGGELRGPTDETLQQPPLRPMTSAEVTGPDVPDTSVHWTAPGPVVTRGEERTTFTPAELAEAAQGARSAGTPEQVRQAFENVQPPTDFTRQNVFMNSEEAQQAEINKALAVQGGQIETIRNLVEQGATPEEAVAQVRQQAAPQEQVKPPTVPQQQTAPPVTPQGRAAGQAEPWVSKIANRFTVERMAAGDLGPVEPGHGVTKEEMLARGLQMGPEEVTQHVSNLMNNVGGDPKAQAAAVRVEEARLTQRSRDASRVSEADPANRQARIDANNAFQDLTDFHNGPVAKLKNNWHAQGMTLQGEIPADLSTYNGLREQFLKDTGKAPPPNAEPVLRNTAKRVRDASVAETAAMNNLGAEIDRQSAKRFLPTDEQVREKIIKRMRVEPCPT